MTWEPNSTFRVWEGCSRLCWDARFANQYLTPPQSAPRTASNSYKCGPGQNYICLWISFQWDLKADPVSCKFRLGRLIVCVSQSIPTFPCLDRKLELNSFQMGKDMKGKYPLPWSVHLMWTLQYCQCQFKVCFQWCSECFCYKLCQSLFPKVLWMLFLLGSKFISNGALKAQDCYLFRDKVFWLSTAFHYLVAELNLPWGHSGNWSGRSMLFGPERGSINISLRANRIWLDINLEWRLESCWLCLPLAHSESTAVVSICPS